MGNPEKRNVELSSGLMLAHPDWLLKGRHYWNHSFYKKNELEEPKVCTQIKREISIQSSVNGKSGLVWLIT